MICLVLLHCPTILQECNAESVASSFSGNVHYHVNYLSTTISTTPQYFFFLNLAFINNQPSFVCGGHI